MKRVVMQSAPGTCPRCMGSGKVSFRPSNGICYRCKGTGRIAQPKIDPQPTVAPIDPGQVAEWVAFLKTLDDNDDWINALFSYGK